MFVYIFYLLSFYNGSIQNKFILANIEQIGTKVSKLSNSFSIVHDILWNYNLMECIEIRLETGNLS